MEEILQIVSNIGFPMAVAVYLLVRLEGKLDALTHALQDLTENIKHGIN
ncbi:hypothetical protein HMPREF9225_1985 [Peptoniphilus duerdenii ATCC BAA-1640]|uniref:YvrJ family protein n=1 Tax=Peptoniphilus duerdenii ATCC BAA-1640 TaxID=862517 RepID=E0NP96_9FIRM|nr:YvrJ family protein [Peptoniphilus duerdenii]EFM24389.1 hypothetical protein HMPREF9225_1985 [Peptoniphilus duerdenii ATCC BAA-1640]